MWNRLVQHGPQPANRNPPLPGRRQPGAAGPPPRATNGIYQAGRPALSQASTVSLISDTSEASLANKNSRARAESNLRHAISSSPPPDVPPPLEVLEEIMGIKAGGKTPRASKTFDESSSISYADLDTYIDFGNISLSDYVQVEGPVDSTTSTDRAFGPPAGTHDQLQADYERFKELHQSVAECDAVLQTVEAHLTRFRTDLGLVSNEIEALQARSSLLTSKLENRKNVEKLLGPSVEEISISPLVVKKISEGEIDEDWGDALHEVGRWSKSVLDKPRDQRAKATEDMQVLAENLIKRAIERIREHLVKQVKSLRQPNANAQLIQRQRIAKSKQLYDFLYLQNRKSAEEISQAYFNGLRWYYQYNFEKYQKALEKLDIHQTDKSDLLGEDDAPKKRKDNPTHHLKSSSHFFALQRRADIIRASTPATPAYLTSADTSVAIYLESPFRSFNLALLDNACAEYAFLTSYFTHLGYSALSTRFAYIFAPTFALGQNLTNHLVSQSTDCLGILICIRLNQSFALESQRRKVAVLEPYINAINLLLWPRFQKAVDAHCESLRHAASSSVLAPRSITHTLSSITGSSTTLSLAPHFLTQRFAQFIHGILSLSSPQLMAASGAATPSSTRSNASEVTIKSPSLTSDEEPIGRSLLRLRGEFEGVMNKLSKDLGGDARRKERFMSNNYGLIRTILGDVPGTMAEEMRDWLRSMGGDGGIS